MSDEREPPPGSIVYDLRPVAQLTRATVHGNQIDFEIQAPDANLASGYALSLGDTFGHEFRTAHTKDACPVDVKLDDKDASKIIATYNSEGRPKNTFEDAFSILDAVRSAGVKVSDEDVRGILVSKSADMSVRRAFADFGIIPVTWTLTQEGEIRFDVHVSALDRDELRRWPGPLKYRIGERFRHAVEDRYSRRGSKLWVEVDEDERQRVTVVYRPNRKRDLGDDMVGIIGVLEDMGIPITDTAKAHLQDAFTAAWKAPGGHAAAEAARRSAKKGPGGPER